MTAKMTMSIGKENRMNDVISRQDAIDAIKTMPIVEAMGFISTLPSAQCDDCPYRAHWLTAEINSNRRNGGATA